MLTAIYWLSINLYAVVLHIAALFNPKAKLFVKGRKGLLKTMHYALINERRPRIWMHCASLGEFEQGRPLLEKLRKQYPQYAYVLTFFSPSGYEVRKDYEGADYVFYLPLDSRRNARKFLSVVQPKLCLFVKYEFWYFLLSEIAKRDIPNVLVSAIFRKDQPFFKWYGGLHRRMLHAFSHIFVQTDASLHLLGKIGVHHADKAGDTRFDRVQEAMAELKALPLADAFCEGQKVIVAGSTWPADEQFLKDAFEKLKTHNWKLIIVPHEVHESHISAIEKLFDGQAAKWTDDNTGDKQVLIVDAIGVLFSLYSYARVAWVGGGLGKDGVHNVLEAAVHNIPVTYGPVYEQYNEAVELVKQGGALVFNDADTFTKQLIAWDKDPYSYEHAANKAHEYIVAETGATARIITYLEAKKWLSVS